VRLPLVQHVELDPRDHAGELDARRGQRRASLGLECRDGLRECVGVEPARAVG